MVQGHIADMALDVDAAALLVYRAAWTKDMGAARVSREASMAKLFATDRAQSVIDKAVQLHGGDGVQARLGGGAPLPRDQGAPHLRGRLGRAEDRDRTTGSGGRIGMLGPSAHIGHIHARSSSAAGELAGVSARRLRLSGASQRRGGADRPHGGARLRRPYGADRPGAHAHLQGAGRLDQPAGARAGGGSRHRARQPRAHPLRQHAGDGRLLAGGGEGGRRGHQHAAGDARRRPHQGDRQGGGEAGALRHAADGRAGRRRQVEPLPQDGDRLRRHGEFRRRARPPGARQAGALRGGEDRPRRCRAHRLFHRRHRRAARDAALPPRPARHRRRLCQGRGRHHARRRRGRHAAARLHLRARRPGRLPAALRRRLGADRGRDAGRSGCRDQDLQRDGVVRLAIGLSAHPGAEGLAQGSRHAARRRLGRRRLAGADLRGLDQGLRGVRCSTAMAARRCCTSSCRTGWTTPRR